jgi:hypothetical protein
MDCYQRALGIARRQDARSLELRAAISLARLLRRDGNRPAARDVLLPVFQSFTEGFDTSDVREAAALLTDLGVPVDQQSGAIGRGQ